MEDFTGIIVAWLVGFALLLALLGVLKAKTKLSFSVRVFIAMAIGIALGLGVYFVAPPEAATEIRKWFSLVGQGFIDLLKMLIIPLVPTAIIAGLLKLQGTKELKLLGGRTIAMFLGTAFVASVIGLLIASLFNLGSGVVTTGLAERSPQTVVDLFAQFRGFIPANPVLVAAETKLVPLVVFALFIGIAAVIEAGRNPKRIEPFANFVDALLAIVTRVTKFVIKLTPYGVLALTAYWLSHTGLAAIPSLALFVVGVVVACLIHVALVYGGLIAGVAKVNPFRFFRASAPALAVAFTSRSSAGTLTLTIDTMINRLKVSPKYANFVGPIGAVMNMDACGGIFPAMVSIFAANAFGIELSVVQYILIVVVSILASLGSAAVPMGATAFTVITLSTVGLPVEAIGLVAGVDFIVDMFRTATNVAGDLTTSVVVGNSLGEFDKKAFEEQDLSGKIVIPATAEGSADS